MTLIDIERDAGHQAEDQGSVCSSPPPSERDRHKLEEIEHDDAQLRRQHSLDMVDGKPALQVCIGWSNEANASTNAQLS